MSHLEFTALSPTHQDETISLIFLIKPLATQNTQPAKSIVSVTKKACLTSAENNSSKLKFPKF